VQTKIDLWMDRLPMFLLALLLDESRICFASLHYMFLLAFLASSSFCDAHPLLLLNPFVYAIAIAIVSHRITSHRIASHYP